MQINAKFVVAVFIVMSAISLLEMIILTTRIDNIIHNELYEFGLRFSQQWATPYWNYSGTVLVSSWFTILGSVLLLYYLYKNRVKAGSWSLAEDRIGTETEVDAEEEVTATSASDEQLVEAQLNEPQCILCAQIKRYNVRKPKAVIDSQC